MSRLVKEGKIILVEIISKGIKGDGIAKVKNFTVFVKGTIVGDKLKVKIKKVLKWFAFAEKIAV